MLLKGHYFRRMWQILLLKLCYNCYVNRRSKHSPNYRLAIRVVRNGVGKWNHKASENKQNNPINPKCLMELDHARYSESHLAFWNVFKSFVSYLWIICRYDHGQNRKHGCLEMTSRKRRARYQCKMTTSSSTSDENLVQIATFRYSFLPDMQNCGLRMRQECRERFPATAG